MRIRLDVNDTVREIDVDPDLPLLWVLRERLSLTGTKYGCGVGLCGVCTVHVDGEAVRSCTVSASEVAERRIVTIEGLEGSATQALRHAWVVESVPQCGYCQAGQIMQAAALLASQPIPTDEAIIEAMSDNLCRCGTYGRILRAIRRAAGRSSDQ